MSASLWTKISAATLSHVMGNERIGEPPLLLRPEPAWLAFDEQRRADALAQAELRQLGWIDQRGRVEGEVLDCLHLLGHPPIEYGAIFDADGLPRRVVAVGSGEVGVLARREGPVIQLAALQDELLPENLLRQLPDVPPAATLAVNIRRADVSATDAFGQDGQVLRQFAGQELLGAGELCVGTRDRYGRHRVSPAIRYGDYPIGRVLVVVSDDYLTVAPASRNLLLARLHEARTAIAA